MKVISIDESSIKFEGGIELYSSHEQSCCESHYLSFKDLTIDDFEGLEFDLSNDSFFEMVDGFGIRLIPLNGHPVSVPGYGYNNGYYSSNLTLELSDGRSFDISECQDIKL